MSPDRSVTAFAPATIGNVICGFDIFGLALEAPGDAVTAHLSDHAGLRIRSIKGDGGHLPTDPERNSATVAIAALLSALGRDDGLEVSIDKGLPLSGGMGGSAASAVAAVVAADGLLETGFSRDALLRFALEGERMAAGSGHLDNIAPALFGGLLLVRPGHEPEIVSLPIPDGLSVALLHPEIELNTKAGREVLGSTVPLSEAVAQWGNTAAFVHALHIGDLQLLADSLEDRVAEPRRSGAIPAFEEVREAAVEAGALACGIAGAGPSMFSLCRNEASAAAAGDAMLTAYRANATPAAHLYLSPVSREGARVTSSDEVGVG